MKKGSQREKKISMISSGMKKEPTGGKSKETSSQLKSSSGRMKSPITVAILKKKFQE